MSVCLRTIVLALAFSSAATALAGDAYYNIPLQELKLVDGKLPVRTSNRIYNWNWTQTLRPYVVLDGPGEAYVSDANNPWFPSYFAVPEASAPDSEDRPAVGTRVFVRAAAGKEVTGRVVLPNGDSTGMVSLKFTIPASAATSKAKTAFYRGKIAHYEELLGRDVPGGAWFRHQIRLARAELNLPAGTEVNRAWQAGRVRDLADTYDLFTGGRAISENLQLDRVLPTARPDETPVKIDSIKGITINEIDWKPLIKDAIRNSIRWPTRFRPISTLLSSPASRRRWRWPTRRTSTTRRCCGWPSRGRRMPGSSSATSAARPDAERGWRGSWAGNWSRAWP